MASRTRYRRKMPRLTASKKTLSVSDRVLRAAAKLLRTGGVDAVSTRAVAAEAGLQAPAIYRQFGDKEGLLDAVALFVVQEYLADKRRIRETSTDALDELRKLWDLHIQFGLTNPHTYVLTYGHVKPGKTTPADKETLAILQEAIARVAAEGRLRMSVERAAGLMHSAEVGTVLTLLREPEDDRDPQLSRLSRESVFASILNEKKKMVPAKASELSSRAVALQEALRGTRAAPLSGTERAMLTEWLGKLADRQ
jgi:AcrR family transcriptional regulator